MELPEIELPAYNFELPVLEDMVLEYEPFDVQLPDLTMELPILDVELPTLEALELPAL